MKEEKPDIHQLLEVAREQAADNSLAPDIFDNARAFAAEISDILAPDTVTVLHDNEGVLFEWHKDEDMWFEVTIGVIDKAEWLACVGNSGKHGTFQVGAASRRIVTKYLGELYGVKKA